MTTLTMGSLSEKKKEIYDLLGKSKQWEERFKFIINFGRSLPSYPDDLRKEEFLVPGCLSRVWLSAKLVEGRIQFLADADSAFMKGMIGLLLEIYSSRTPTEILSENADFLQEAGFTQHLSPNRRNGLSQMFKMIHEYARKFSMIHSP